MDFSVLVLLYNSEKKALERTLESVLRQKGVSFEIVLADDCSKNDCLAQAVEYLKDKGVKVKVSHQETNGGTVNNILDALRLCDGKYIKPIGAGDLLFDNKCLYIAKNTFDKDQEIVFNHMGLLGVSGNYAVEFDILAACFTAMAIWRHRANIKRLLSGTENKFGQKAK